MGAIPTFLAYMIVDGQLMGGSSLPLVFAGIGCLIAVFGWVFDAWMVRRNRRTEARLQAFLEHNVIRA